jgi:hypothetical protein
MYAIQGQSVIKKFIVSYWTGPTNFGSIALARVYATKKLAEKDCQEIAESISHYGQYRLGYYVRSIVELTNEQLYKTQTLVGR